MNDTDQPEADHTPPIRVYDNRVAVGSLMVAVVALLVSAIMAFGKGYANQSVSDALQDERIDILIDSSKRQEKELGKVKTMVTTLHYAIMNTAPADD